MTITDNVIRDLLPAYLSGEASPDTITLVEEFLRRDPALAREAESARAATLLDVPELQHPTREKETLNRTKRLLHWRGLFLALAAFLTLLPFSVGGGSNKGVTWIFLRDTPIAVTAAIWLGAAISWIAYLRIRQRLQSTGL